MEKLKSWWESWEGLSSSTIKIVAVISMLIDHTAAGILGRYLNQADIRRGLFSPDQTFREEWMAKYGSLYATYNLMRDIGRLAFPIYCYFLVEGLKYTRNQWKYLARLCVFAILSEIPFDLLFEGKVLEFSYQNVYFTLAIGLLVIIGMKEMRQRISSRWLFMFLGWCVFGAGCVLAVILRTDYSFKGVFCIMVIYLFSHTRWKQLLAGAIVFCWELPAAPMAFFPLSLYKKKRGLKLKYFFYLFYPAHLFALYLVTKYLGIWELPAL